MYTPLPSPPGPPTKGENPEPLGPRPGEPGMPPTPTERAPGGNCGGCWEGAPRRERMAAPLPLAAPVGAGMRGCVGGGGAPAAVLRKSEGKPPVETCAERARSGAGGGSEPGRRAGVSRTGCCRATRRGARGGPLQPPDAARWGHHTVVTSG